MGRKICWTENISPHSFLDFEAETVAASYSEQGSHASLPHSSSQTVFPTDQSTSSLKS